MSEHKSFKGFISESRYSELMVPIPRFYLNDSFNYFGLPDLFSKNYSRLFKMLNQPEYFRAKCEVDELMSEALTLYGYLHARFLSSDDGIDYMMDFYKSRPLPMCPRKLCKTKCLPYGISDALGKFPVMFYCPCCHDVYDLKIKRYRKFDGGWFGPTYVHLFESRMKSKSPGRRFCLRGCEETEEESEVSSERETDEYESLEETSSGSSYTESSGYEEDEESTYEESEHSGTEEESYNSGSSDEETYEDDYSGNLFESFDF